RGGLRIAAKWKRPDETGVAQAIAGTSAAPGFCASPVSRWIDVVALGHRDSLDCFGGGTWARRGCLASVDPGFTRQPLVDKTLSLSQTQRCFVGQAAPEQSPPPCRFALSSAYKRGSQPAVVPDAALREKDGRLPERRDRF